MLLGCQLILKNLAQLFSCQSYLHWLIVVRGKEGCSLDRFWRDKHHTAILKCRAPIQVKVVRSMKIPFYPFHRKEYFTHKAHLDDAKRQGQYVTQSQYLSAALQR